MICPACGYDDTREVTGSYTIILEMSAPSGNKIGANAKGPAGYRYRGAQAKYRRALNLKVKNIPPAKGKRRLWITRFYGKRKRPYDTDNLAWGLKPLVDELVNHGALIDDTPKYVERYYKQQSADCDHIVIVLEDIQCE